MTQQTQQQQAQQASGNYDSRLGVLESTVHGISSRLDSIATKLDNQGKVPWGTIITAGLGTVGLTVTIIGSIGALAFSPLSAGIADVKAAVTKFETRTENYMKREDIVAQVDALRLAVREQMEVAKERRNDLQSKTEDRIARTEKDIGVIQDQLVSRREHESYRALQTRDYDLLRDRLSRIEGRFIARTDGLGREIEKMEDRSTARADRRIEALEGSARR